VSAPFGASAVDEFTLPQPIASAIATHTILIIRHGYHNSGCGSEQRGTGNRRAVPRS